MTQRIRTYRYWPKNDPLPDGAKMISQFEGIVHGKYSVLIELKHKKHTGEAS